MLLLLTCIYNYQFIIEFSCSIVVRPAILPYGSTFLWYKIFIKGQVSMIFGESKFSYQHYPGIMYEEFHKFT